MKIPRINCFFEAIIKCLFTSKVYQVLKFITLTTGVCTADGDCNRRNNRPGSFRRFQRSVTNLQEQPNVDARWCLKFYILLLIVGFFFFFRNLKNSVTFYLVAKFELRNSHDLNVLLKINKNTYFPCKLKEGIYLQ